MHLNWYKHIGSGDEVWVAINPYDGLEGRILAKRYRASIGKHEWLYEAYARNSAPHLSFVKSFNNLDDAIASVERVVKAYRLRKPAAPAA